jgi:VCBS repeat-containing protein
MPGYATLVAQRGQYQQNIAQLQGLIGTNMVRVLQVAGDVDELNVQLGSVRGTIAGNQGYNSDLSKVVAKLDAEISRRPKFVWPQGSGEAPTTIDAAALVVLDVRTLSDSQLGLLYYDVAAERGEVSQDTAMLRYEEQNLLNQIVLQQGELTTVNQNLQVLQTNIATMSAELGNLNAQIMVLQQAVAGVDAVLAATTYDLMDAAARNLQAYMDLFSADFRGTLQGLLTQREYTMVDADLQRTTSDLNNVMNVLQILDGMDDIGYVGRDAKLRALSGYMNWIKVELQGVVLSITESRYKDTPYQELADNLANVDAEIGYFQGILNIVGPLVEQLDDLYYPHFDAELRKLSQYMAALLPELGREVQALYTSPKLTTLDQDLDNVIQAIAWRTQLDQVMVDLTAVQTTIFQLQQNIDAGYIELQNHPNLDTIIGQVNQWQGQVDFLANRLAAHEWQLKNVAYNYLTYQLEMYGAVNYWLIYANDELVSRGVPADYRTPKPFSDTYSKVILDTRDGNFYLTPRDMVPWQYFDIAGIGYGVGDYTLGQLNATLIQRMKTDELVVLRNDLLVSWGKGNKDPKNPQYGDIALARDTLRNEGVDGWLDDKLPQDRPKLLEDIGSLAGSLANARQQLAYWSNEQAIVTTIWNNINTWETDLQLKRAEEFQLTKDRNTFEGYLKSIGYDRFTRGELEIIKGNLSVQRDKVVRHIDVAALYLPAEQEALLHELGILNNKRAAIEQDVIGLQRLLDDAGGILADVVPSEQNRLWNEYYSLYNRQYVYSNELWQVTQYIDWVTGMVPYERPGLMGQLSELTWQYDDINYSYQGAVQQEGVFIGQRNVLDMELTMLNTENQGHGDTILGYQAQLAGLAGQESTMRSQLTGILQQKQTDRLDLGFVQGGSQQLEAGFLFGAQDLVFLQSDHLMGDLVERFRGTLDAMTSALRQSEVGLTSLKAQELTVRTQLLAAQQTNNGPATIRIEAAGFGNFLSDSGESDIQYINKAGDASQGPSQIVEQEPFHGFYIYRDPDTGELYYRSVGDIPYDPDYVYDPDSGVVIDNDLSDDVLYQGMSAQFAGYYRFDAAWSVRSLADVTTQERTEFREDTREYYDITIESDLFRVEDFRLDIFKTSPDLDPSDETLYVLNAAGTALVPFAGRFNPLLSQVNGLLGAGDDPAVVEMYLLDGSSEAGYERNVIRVTFFDFVPVYTQVPAEQVVFQDPEELANTVYGVDDELPTVYGEVLLNGKLLEPVIRYDDGGIHLLDVSFTASSLLSMIAAGAISGTNNGGTYSAPRIVLESTGDFHIASELIAAESISVSAGGSLYLDGGAKLSAPSVLLNAGSTSVIASPDSLITADHLVITSGGSVIVNTDTEQLTIDTLTPGDVFVNNVDWNGDGSSLTLSHVHVNAGHAAVVSNVSIMAAYVAADAVNLVTWGNASVAIGTLTAYGSGPVYVDSARYITDLYATPAHVVAGMAELVAGLDITAMTEWAGVEVLWSSNLSVLVDETYTGPMEIYAEREIIVDGTVIANGDVAFSAQNIVFTGNGSLVNTSGGLTTLMANGVLSFSGYSFDPFARYDLGGLLGYGEHSVDSRSKSYNLLKVYSPRFVMPVGVTAKSGGSTFANPLKVQAGEIHVAAGFVTGGDSAVISGASLDIWSGGGFVLNTQVNAFSAQVLGRGDVTVHAASSIELVSVNVLDGDFTVNAGGNVIVRDVTIQTDRYSNSLNFFAGGGLSIGRIEMGRTVALQAEAGALINVADGLVITPEVLSGLLYEGDVAVFRFRIDDPSRMFSVSYDEIELVVDFGDGTPARTIPVPLVQNLAPESLGKSWDVVFGSQSGSLFGAAVASGDVNGDGFDDLIIGEKWYDVPFTGGLNAGRILVYLGSPAGLSSQPATVITGWQGGAEFGSTLASGFDVNDDGFEDVIVSAPYRTTYKTVTTVNPDGTISTYEVPVTGQVLVFLGSAGGLEQEPVWMREDIVADETLGIPVASAGDVNADGYDDILIGSPGEDVYVLENGQAVLHERAGEVYLYLGGASGPETDVAWTYHGSMSGGQFGIAIAAAGDLNKDGYDDVIIGDPEDVGAAGKSVYVFLGGSSGLKARPAMVLESDQTDALFGVILSGIGDVNGDGNEDIAVSAPYYTGAEDLSGAVFVYFGADKDESVYPLSSTSWTIGAPEGIKLFGYAVTGAGDVNGDGYDDLMIRGLYTSGGEVDTGVTFLYLGSKTGLQPVTITLNDGRQVHPFTAGTQSLAAGDVNRDGYSDMMLGAWAYGLNSEGAVFIYRGGQGFDFAAPAIGTVDLDHVYSQYGTYTVTVTAQLPGGTSSVGSTSLKVEGYPVAVSDQITTDEDTSVTFTLDDLLGNDYDPDAGDTVIFNSIDTRGLKGTLTFISGTTYRYSPNGQFENLKAGETGIDTFTYTVRDKMGATCTGTVTIRITPVLPVVTGWQLYDDTGIDAADKLTYDTTPVLRFTFSEPVYGQAAHIVVMGPGGISVTPGSIMGWGTMMLTVRFVQPLTRNGVYRVTLTSAITDVGKNPLNAGAGAVAAFELDTQGPRVQVLVNGGQNQRSNISSLQLLFNDDMNIASVMAAGLIDDYVRIFNLSTPEAALSWVTADRFSWDAESGVLTIDTTVDGFGGSEMTAFEDGYLEVRVNAGRLRDAAGNRLLEDDAVINGWLVIDRTIGSPVYDLFRLLGDSNGDAMVNGADLAIWQRNYDPKGRHDNTPALGDWNLDGRIDGADMVIWQRQIRLVEMPRVAVMQLPADANGDAKVDGIDLAIWQRHYDPAGVNDNGPDTGDWNRDGRVDTQDLNVWQQNYSPVPRTSSTPLDKSREQDVTPPVEKTAERSATDRTARVKTDPVSDNPVREPVRTDNRRVAAPVAVSDASNDPPSEVDASAESLKPADTVQEESTEATQPRKAAAESADDNVEKDGSIANPTITQGESEPGPVEEIADVIVWQGADARDREQLDTLRLRFSMFDTRALFEAAFVGSMDRAVEKSFPSEPVRIGPGWDRFGGSARRLGWFSHEGDEDDNLIW